MKIQVFLLIISITVRNTYAGPCLESPTAVAQKCECATPNTDDCEAPKACSGKPGETGRKCEEPPKTGGNGQQGGGGGTGAVEAPLRCQNKDGSLLPSATICTDKLGTDACKQIFEPVAPPQGSSNNAPPNTNGNNPNTGNANNNAPQGSGDKRPEKCDLPELTDFARQCAKTCKICCETVEHGCEDNPAFNVECENVKFNCKFPTLESTMAIACPRTCGLCGVGDCKDTAPGCDSMKGACQDYVLRPYVGQHCQRTCKICTPGGGGGLSAPTRNCANSGVDCDRYARDGWCQGTPEQRNSMWTWCPKSCGWC